MPKCRQGRVSTPADCPMPCSGGLAYWMWIRVKLGEAVLFSSSVMWLSAAMCVFLVYNLIAGGNPPKKDKGDEMAVPSA